MLGWHLVNPGPSYWRAAKRVLRYLVGSAETGLNFDGRVNGELVAYSDADFAGCPIDRKSTIVLILCGAPVVWSSKKQNVVATSTTEAEYVAAHDVTKDVLWTRALLKEIDIERTGPTVLNIDNQAAICLIKNATFHRRTKYIDVKYQFTRSIVKLGEIEVVYVKTDLQFADIFTKPLPRPAFEQQLGFLNLF